MRHSCHCLRDPTSQLERDCFRVVPAKDRNTSGETQIVRGRQWTQTETRQFQLQRLLSLANNRTWIFTRFIRVLHPCAPE